MMDADEARAAALEAAVRLHSRNDAIVYPESYKGVLETAKKFELYISIGMIS